MSRPRSVSRHPSTRHRDDSVSPTRSRSRPSSTSSSYQHDRCRSQSRGPPARQQRDRTATDSSQASSLSKSAGVLAGIGIAALVARTFWPKSSGGGGGGGSGSTAQKEDRGGGQRRRGAQEYVPRGLRDADHRAHRQSASNASSYGPGDSRYAARAEDWVYHRREARRRSADRRSWGGEDARGYTQSTIGRRYS